jgi:hypothetical protein
MGGPADELFDVTRLRSRWSKRQAATPAPVTPAPARTPDPEQGPTLAEMVETLRLAMEAETGAPPEMIEPLLAQLTELVAEQEAAGDENAPPPDAKRLAAVREETGALLDLLEDVLEGLEHMT